MTKITAIKDGPYAVEGPITITDASGNIREVKTGQSVRLCRCGQSKTKPFCDDSHKLIGFKSDQ